MDKTEHGVALFGTGRIGKVHLHDVIQSRRLKLLYLIEADVRIAHGVHKDFGLSDDVQVLDIKNAEAVYSDPRVRCVLVCTPSASHEDIVRGALDAGKDVFCEKPLALNNSAVDECYKKAKEEDRILFCAFNRRFDPQVRSMNNRIRKGEVGKLRVVKTTSRDSPGIVDIEYIKNSGGIFTDSAVHDIDLLCWLVGEFPSRVYAAGHATDHSYAECGDVDTCYVTLTYPGGAIGNIEVSRNAPVGYDQRIEVFGTKGMLTSGNQSSSTLVLQDLSGIVHEPIIEGFLERYKESYKLELEHFLDVIEGTTAEELTGTAIHKVYIIAEACSKSLHSGQSVELNL